jgi:putative transposase
MRRFELTDEQYQRIAHLLPGKPEDPGSTARDNRLFMDAVLGIARTGAPWPDLPERFGKPDSVDQRLNRWAKSGRWLAIMEALGGDADLEHLLIDSTVIRAHQHAAGARKKAASRPSAARGAVGARRSMSPSTRRATRCDRSSPAARSPT